MSSPRVPRATILPTGPTRTEARIAATPNVLGTGPWIPLPRNPRSPGDLAILLEVPGLVDLLVDAQAEYREPLVLAEVVATGLEIGDLAEARAAAGGPEVEQYVPALGVAEIDCFAFERGRVEIRSNCSESRRVLSEQ